MLLTTESSFLPSSFFSIDLEGKIQLLYNKIEILFLHVSVYLCECECVYVCQQVCVTAYVEVCHGQWNSVHEIRFGMLNMNFHWGREGTHRTFGKL